MSPNSPKHPNNIGKVIKRHRWKLEQVAERTNIPRRTLIDYCQGKTAVPRDRLEALSRCLRYPAKYLVPPFPEAHLFLSEGEQAKEAQNLLALQTHWKAHPTDENALREFMVLLGMHGRYEEIEQCYAIFLKKLEQFTRREPDPSTTALLEEFRTQKSLISENGGNVLQTEEAALKDLATHAPEASALPQTSSSGRKVEPPLSPSSEDNMNIAILNSIDPLQEQAEDAKNESASSPTQENVVQSESAIQLSGRASLWMPSQDLLPLDLPTRLFARVNELKTIGNRQSQVMTDAEIKNWTTMTDQDHQPTSETLTTRRNALVALALFPPTLLAKIQSWSPFDTVSTVVAKDFLTQCAHSITACNHLLKGDGLATVEYALSQYLPQLLTLGKSPSPVQHEAANLASQGCCLMSTIKIHRLQYHETVTCCKQAVELAQVTGDNQLIAAALTELGDAWFYVNQPQKYLKAYQQAESLIPKATRHALLAQEPDQFPPLLQCCIYTGLSDAYAVLERSQEAEYYLNLANAIPLSPDDDRFIPALRYDLSSRDGLTGSIERKLGEMEDKKKAPDKARPHYEKAEAMLIQSIESPHTSERLRVLDVNGLSLVAVKLGDLGKFKEYLILGTQGAKSLESDYLLGKAKRAWRAGKRRWPHEDQVAKLAEVLVDDSQSTH